MTKKQIAIIETALRLFAEEGYDATSTSRIAKEAGVSEGLIFRHFKRKSGLLDAIMDQAKSKIDELFEWVKAEEHPHKVIERIIETPFLMDEASHHFWRLIYTLKWQQSTYDRTAVSELIALAVGAFEALGYDNPEAEAEVLEMILDGAATAILLKGETINRQLLMETVKKKYKIKST